MLDPGLTSNPAVCHMCDGSDTNCMQIADTTSTQALDPAVKAETLTAPGTR